jgi:hypothetical protein
MPEYALGQPVLVTGLISREGDEDNVRRWWQPYTNPGAPVRAVVVGKRTLSNGTVHRWTESDGWGPKVVIREWHPTEHFPAYLVAVDLWLKPFFVLPDQIVGTP